ncbi:MAG: hypothetical protein V4632_11595 [Pseudomonadota bacterium]
MTNLTEALLQFQNSQPGTDAYKELKAACLNLIKGDPHNAAAYYLIAGFARSYVILHEEEAVTFEMANAAKAQMLDYLRRIESILTSLSADARMSSLNSIVLDYLQSDKIF